MSVQEDTASAVRSEITRAIQEATGLHEQYASTLAEGIWERFRERWGGSRMHIPAVDRAARNAAIRDAFDGRNHSEVCARYGISRATLYRVIGNLTDC